MDKKHKVTQYKQNSKELTDILNSWDPIGVLPYKGGPKDEYECFITPILTVLQRDHNKEDLIKAVDIYLVEHFGLPERSTRVDAAAEKIITWWNTKKNS